ncbi:MAG TPA: site-2 protease family protein [Planctomycetaceae bacterium]|nr:site-2 protease family protein [Planctomycetaceae bacterium]
MTNLHNPLFWSFGLGSWFGVRVRVSWLMPLVLAWLLFEFKLQFGGAIFGALVLSVFLHEIGHILAARAMDGSGDEILIWPLGGVAFVDHSSAPLTQFVTAIGGPVVNLLLCGLCLPAVMADGPVWDALNPLTLAVSSRQFETKSLLVSLQLLLFSLNWMMLVVNLLPVFPLDGGQVVRSWLTSRLGAQMAMEISIRIGYVAGIVLAVVAMLIFKHVVLLGLAFLILLLTMQESFQLQAGEAFDDSFMGYDFSQGYTSLEKSDRSKREPRPGLVARWLESRRQEKQRRLEEQHQEVDQQLDAILAKVHEQGMQALSPSERRLLKRASDRFRSKGQEGP